MKFTLAKQNADVALEGIKVDIEWHDRSAKAVTLTDANGRIVRISKGESYGGLDILIPAPPVKVDRWRVSGQIPGINEAEKVNVTEDEAAAHEPRSLAREEVAF